MKILDWYIVKKYLSTFFFIMLLITMIALSINYFEWIDKFINSKLSFPQIFVQYYIYFIPYINGLLWPLFAMLAVIFFTSRMAKNSEIISMLSAKISYRRLMRPYIISASFIGGLLWLGNNYVIPRSNVHKNAFEIKYIKPSLQSTLNHNIHFWLSKEEKIYIRSYSSHDSSGRFFRLERFKNNELIYSLKANKLKYIGAPNKWKLEGWEERKFYENAESMVSKPIESKDTTFNFIPEDFTRYTNQMELMTSGELRRFLKYEQEKGLDSGKKYSIELYRRTAEPFTIFILTIIGIAVASRKVRGGMGFHIAAGIIMGAAYVILSKFSTTFSTNLALHPLLGVWIPNIMFSLVAMYLLKTAQK